MGFTNMEQCAEECQGQGHLRAQGHFPANGALRRHGPGDEAALSRNRDDVCSWALLLVFL
jgi:hypothetical protein